MGRYVSLDTSSVKQQKPIPHFVAAWRHHAQIGPTTPKSDLTSVLRDFLEAMTAGVEIIYNLS